MRTTPLKPDLERVYWKAEGRRTYSAKVRGVLPNAIPSVPQPQKAHLSADGILSWEWHSRAVLHSLDTSPLLPFRRIDARLCERFAALSDKSDQAIRRFAELWGPLRYSKSKAGSGEYTEALSQWRRFATLARALVRCSVALSAREPGLPEDWHSISAWLAPPIERAPSAEHGLLLVAMALNRWHARSPGSSLVEVQNNKIVLRPHSGFLFGIIGLQLTYVITGAQQTLVCYHCSKFYRPKNKPRTGSRNFCPRCQRLGKPQVYAMRDLRARQKQPVGGAVIVGPGNRKGGNEWVTSSVGHPEPRRISSRGPRP